MKVMKGSDSDLESIAYSSYGTPSSSSKRTLDMYQQPRKPILFPWKYQVCQRPKKHIYILCDETFFRFKDIGGMWDRRCRRCNLRM